MRKSKLSIDSRPVTDVGSAKIVMVTDKVKVTHAKRGAYLKTYSHPDDLTETLMRVPEHEIMAVVTIAGYDHVVMHDYSPNTGKFDKPLSLLNVDTGLYLFGINNIKNKKNISRIPDDPIEFLKMVNRYLKSSPIRGLKDFDSAVSAGKVSASRLVRVGYYR